KAFGRSVSLSTVLYGNSLISFPREYFSKIMCDLGLEINMCYAIDEIKSYLDVDLYHNNGAHLRREALSNTPNRRMELYYQLIGAAGQ
ncbi:unnamed protein product, partial [marine sediment metagenome]